MEEEKENCIISSDDDSVVEEEVQDPPKKVKKPISEAKRKQLENARAKRKVKTDLNKIFEQEQKKQKEIDYNLYLEFVKTHELEKLKEKNSNINKEENVHRNTNIPSSSDNIERVHSIPSVQNEDKVKVRRRLRLHEFLRN